MQLIYLLHLPEPLKHAKHYLGSTENIAQRLQDHATGHGARITQEYHNQNLEWILAALWSIPEGHTPRQIERTLKKHKAGPKLCPICNPRTTSPNGLIQIETLPIHSSQIRTNPQWLENLPTATTPKPRPTTHKSNSTARKQLPEPNTTKTTPDW